MDNKAESDIKDSTAQDRINNNGKYNVDKDDNDKDEEQEGMQDHHHLDRSGDIGL